MTCAYRYPGAILAILVCIAGAVVWHSTSTPRVPYSPHTATTTRAYNEKSLFFKEPAKSASTATSTTQMVSDTTEQSKPPQEPVLSPTEPSAPVTTHAPAYTGTDSTINASASALRDALVNILCIPPPSSGLDATSGSGIFVSREGLIITNAHIAQYLLLSDKGASCIIRTGSPARDTYRSGLAYVSPEWIRENPTTLTEAEPTGTGEYDFAIVAVTESASDVPLPSSFPYVSLSYLAIDPGSPVVIASYGAQFIDSQQVVSALSPTVVFGSVHDIFTFDTNTVDVFSIQDSVAAQAGSSGGGVADAYGQLTGVITTSTSETTTIGSTLSAITSRYIRAEYERETGSSLDSLLTSSPADAIAAFAPSIPDLAAIIAVHAK